MGYVGADVGEDADVSGDVGLCSGGEDGLGGGEARWLVCYRFPRVCGELWVGRPPKQFPILSPFQLRCVFGQPEEEKW